MIESDFTTEELNSEHWKPVVGFEDRYEVSNLGRVVSLRFGGRDGLRKMLALSCNGNGYVVITLRGSRIVCVAVHRLVAQAFLPEPHPSQTHVHHRDSIRKNNRVSNLEWCTPQENLAYRHGRPKPPSQYPGYAIIATPPPDCPDIMRHAPATAAQPLLIHDGFTAKEVANEIWKPIDGIPPYEVSSLGRVRTTVGYQQRPAGYILKRRLSTTGCWTVCLQTSAGGKNTQIHRLVAQAFLGDPPDGKRWVNHKDGDRQNARMDNLEWVSPKENAQHAKQVLGAYPEGAQHRMAKLTEAQVLEIHELRMRGYAAHYIAKIYNVRQITVQRILRRQAWRKLLAGLPADYPPIIHWGKRGEGNSQAKISTGTARAIKAMIAKGCPTKDIVNALGVPRTTVNNIRYGGKWKHLDSTY